jgi:hypothetical protein
MRPTILLASAVTALTITSAAAAQGPRSTPISVNRGLFAVAPHAGYLINQSFFDGPLNTTLGIQGSTLYGVQVSMPLAPTASLVGTLGYATGDFEAGIPIVGGISLGSSSTLLLDAAVELRLEKQGSRMIPVFQLGGGAIRREVTVLGFTADATDFQVSGGVGADIPITSNIAMRLMAKDYFGPVDFGNVGDLEVRSGDFHTVALTGGLRIAF